MLLATVFALAAAALHAGWNLRVKASDDRFVALWGQFLAAGAVCAAGLVLTGLFLIAWLAAPKYGLLWKRYSASV